MVIIPLADITIRSIFYRSTKKSGQRLTTLASSLAGPECFRVPDRGPFYFTMGSFLFHDGILEMGAHLHMAVGEHPKSFYVRQAFNESEAFFKRHIEDF